jgi:hypothetical protein
MSAPKRKLPPALAANRWRPGQSGNLSGHSGLYGEAMKLAQQAAPWAVRRLIELAELDQIDDQGNLTPLKELPEADRRVVTVAANSLLDRAFGKPKPFDPKADGEEPLSQAALQAEKLTPRELDAIAELAEARLAAIEARQARGECDDGGDST